jgi:hypothetical protein
MCSFPTPVEIAAAVSATGLQAQGAVPAPGDAAPAPADVIREMLQCAGARLRARGPVRFLYS